MNNFKTRCGANRAPHIRFLSRFILATYRVSEQTDGGFLFPEGPRKMDQNAIIMAVPERRRNVGNEIFEMNLLSVRVIRNVFVLNLQYF